MTIQGIQGIQGIQDIQGIQGIQGIQDIQDSRHSRHSNYRPLIHTADILGGRVPRVVFCVCVVHAVILSAVIPLRLQHTHTHTHGQDTYWFQFVYFVGLAFLHGFYSRIASSPIRLTIQIGPICEHRVVLLVVIINWSSITKDLHKDTSWKP
jgi:hypothetical protein